MATKRQTIRSKVATLLRTIRAGADHEVTVNSVFEGVRRYDAVSDYPEIQVEFGDESRGHGDDSPVPTTLGRKGAAMDLECFIVATPDSTHSAEKQCEEILGSMEKVLEATDVNQNFLGLGNFVLNVIVGTEIETFSTEDGSFLLSNHSLPKLSFLIAATYHSI